MAPTAFNTITKTTEGLDYHENVLAALSIAGLTFASASALAGEDFTKYDTDGNGTISMTEAKVNQSLAEQFTQLDSNADGELSESEFANYQG